MNIAENSKQLEYLMTIRDIGMQIIFRKANSKMVIENFACFDRYIEDDKRKYDYIKSLQKVCIGIDENRCSPDDLLFELGQYVPDIIYDDEEEDAEQTALYNDDDSWLYN